MLEFIGRINEEEEVAELRSLVNVSLFYCPLVFSISFLLVYL